MNRDKLLEEVKDVFALVSFGADKVNREGTSTDISSI